MKKFKLLLVMIGALMLFSLPHMVNTSTQSDNPVSTQILSAPQGDLALISTQITVPVIHAVAEEPATADPSPAAPSPVDFVKNNALALLVALMAFIKVVVNLTPTEKDNKVFSLLDNLINWIVPNLKKGGGTHEPE